MNTLRNILILFFIVFQTAQLHAQTGISVTPPRNYFIAQEGARDTKTITVTNLSKNHSLDLSISLNDWEYNEVGENMVRDAGTLDNSCAEWITILPEAIFSLEPEESKELEILMQVPEEVNGNTKIRTAMLYINQLNTTSAVNEQGANIMVSVRSGIKIYHKLNNQRNPEIDPTNFTHEKDKNRLRLEFENIGNIWTDGDLSFDLLHQETGEKVKIKNEVFYTLPGDQRIMYIPLPDGLKVGSYLMSALFEYNRKMKIAELPFDYE